MEEHGRSNGQRNKKKDLLYQLKNCEDSLFTTRNIGVDNFMKFTKTINIIIFSLFLGINLSAIQVEASNKAISKASPGDYIIKLNGDIVYLKQADIDYAKQQLEPKVVQKNQSTTYPIETKTTYVNKSTSGNGSFFSILIIGAIIYLFIRKIFRRPFRNRYSPSSSFDFSGRQSDGLKTYIDQKGYRRFIDSGIPVHRYLAEKKLGRKLYPGEVVHHINRNKLDNSPDNLEIFESQEEHDRIHKESGWY